jgi:predicted HTH domain antitoxin
MEWEFAPVKTLTVDEQKRMGEVTIPYPAGLEESVQTTAGEVQQQIRLMAALKMFELGKLSSGKAAELAGLSRVGFLDACARYKVSVFNYSADELETEIRQDLEHAVRLHAG